MDLHKKAHLIIYRFRERGLEVFLMNSEESESFEFPQKEVGGAPSQQQFDQTRFIELDPVEEESGQRDEAIAVEGDWHEIPSLKVMLFEDAMQLKDKLKEIEKGAFLNLKDALKRALPHQYKFLKELKDILTDRNSIRDL